MTRPNELPYILSRVELEEYLTSGQFSKQHAVISFCDSDLAPIDLVGKVERYITVKVDDLDIDDLDCYGVSFDSFFPEADSVAEFIYKAQHDNYTLIIQCEYGQSRSAGCAAAIYEHFNQNGIAIFSNYNYYPNKLIYHKLMEAFERYKLK